MNARSIKQSKIEWVGSIPSHWSECRLADIATVKARLGWKGLKADEYVLNGYAFLATPNIKDKEIDFQNINFITKERYDESPEIMLQNGDVLLVKDGSTLGIANVIRNLPFPATVNGSIAVIRPSEQIDSIFLYYYFQNRFFQGDIERMKGGMGVPHLFQADLRKFKVIVPPLREQHEIGAFLDREIAKIDSLLARVAGEKWRDAVDVKNVGGMLGVLFQRKAALITAAVTGQIDVSNPMLTEAAD